MHNNFGDGFCNLMSKLPKPGKYKNKSMIYQLGLHVSAKESLHVGLNVSWGVCVITFGDKGEGGRTHSRSVVPLMIKKVGCLRCQLEDEKKVAVHVQSLL